MSINLNINDPFTQAIISEALTRARYKTCTYDAMTHLKVLNPTGAQEQKIAPLLEKAKNNHNPVEIKELQGKITAVFESKLVPQKIGQPLYDKAETRKNFYNGVCRKSTFPTKNSIESDGFRYRGEGFSGGGKQKLFCIASGDWIKTSAGSSDFYNRIHIYDADLKECLKIIPRDPETASISILILIGLKLYLGCRDGKIEVMDFETGKCLSTLEGHYNEPKSNSDNESKNNPVISFASDGKFLYSAACGQTIKIWNPETGECLQTLQLESNAHILAYGHGMLASASRNNKTIQVWDIEKGVCRHTLPTHSDEITGLLFHKQMLYSASRDGIIYAWNPIRGECLNTIKSPQDKIHSLTFFENTLCSGGNNSDIKIWNPKTGECLSTIRSDLWKDQASVTHLTGINGRLFASYGEGGFEFWDFMQSSERVTKETEIMLLVQIAELLDRSEGSLVGGDFEEDRVQSAAERMLSKLSIETIHAIYRQSDVSASQWEAMSTYKKVAAIRKYIKSKTVVSIE